MGIIFFLTFFLSVNQTTLVDPPGQLARYSHIGIKMAEMLLGRKLDIGKVGYIDCVKLKHLPEGADPKEYKYVLTLYGTDEKSNRIIYNKGLMDIGVYGSKGLDKGEFFRPKGIVANSNGDVFVCDMFNNRIVHLYNNGDSLQWIKSFGKFGIDKGEFDRPAGIDMDACNRLYISDMFNNRIVVTDTAGNVLNIIDSLIKPDAIKAVCVKNKMYRRDSFIVVIDMLHTRISKYTLSGKKVRSVTDYDLKLDNAYFSDIDMDLYGNIYVTDKNTCTIHKFDRNLNLITSFGTKGTEKGQFDAPVAMSIYRPYGWFYIVEKKGLSYYWAGVDGTILAITPDTFSRKLPGSTITLYITSEAKITIKIYDENENEIRDLLPVIKRKTGEVHIVWDGLDNKGNVVLPGKYEIRISMKALYSSRRYFKKELKGYIYVKEE